MPTRVTLALAAIALTLLVFAAPAMAADGVGLGGRTTDKDVTLWGFGVMIFFTVMVVVLSLVQGRLDGRKERARADIERLKRD
jgi:hypothetical protein